MQPILEGTTSDETTLSDVKQEEKLTRSELDEFVKNTNIDISMHYPEFVSDSYLMFRFLGEQTDGKYNIKTRHNKSLDEAIKENFLPYGSPDSKFWLAKPSSVINDGSGSTLRVWFSDRIQFDSLKGKLKPSSMLANEFIDYCHQHRTEKVDGVILPKPVFFQLAEAFINILIVDDGDSTKPKRANPIRFAKPRSAWESNFCDEFSIAVDCLIQKYKLVYHEPPAKDENPFLKLRFHYKMDEHGHHEYTRATESQVKAAASRYGVREIDAPENADLQYERAKREAGAEKIKWLEKSASQGKREAVIDLIDIYDKGSCGLDKPDHLKATELYFKLIKDEDTSVINYRFKKYPDATLAVSTKKAEQGDALALAWLGEHYLEAKNHPEAFNCFKKSAEKGNKKGIFRVAYCYENGFGTSQDDKAAIEWYVKVSRGETSFFDVANLLLKDSALNIRLDIANAILNAIDKISKGKPELELFVLLKRIDQGNLGSQVALAVFYLDLKEPGKAIPWLQQVEKNLDSLKSYEYIDFLNCYHMLGDCYKNGSEIKRSDSQALECYEKSEELEAKKLAEIKNRGEEGKDDLDFFNLRIGIRRMGRYWATSKSLFEDLNRWPNEYGETQLGIYYLKKKNYVEALKRLQSAADKNNGEALYHLGACHEHGWGIPPDRSKAIGCYKKAVENGCAEAIDALKKLGITPPPLPPVATPKSATTEQPKSQTAVVLSAVKQAPAINEEKNNSVVPVPVNNPVAAVAPTPANVTSVKQTETQQSNTRLHTPDSAQPMVKSTDKPVESKDATVKREEKTAPVKTPEASEKMGFIVDYLTVMQDDLIRLQAEIEKSAAEKARLSQQLANLQAQGSNAQQLNTISEQLRRVEAIQAESKEELDAKRAQQKVMQRFQKHPNLLRFYRELQIELEHLFISCQAVAGGVVATSYQGELSDVATGISLFGRVASAIPLIGNVVSVLATAMSDGVEKLDHKRQTNSIKGFARLGTHDEFNKLAESIARELTEHYHAQILALPTLEEEKQQKETNNATSTLSRLTERGRARVQEIKSETSRPQAENLASFVVSRTLATLMEGNIQADKPLQLHQELVNAVTAAHLPSRIDAIKQAVIKTLGTHEIITRYGKHWQLHEILVKPGIETADGNYFAGGSADAENYSYRLGTRDEAHARKMEKTTAPVSDPVHDAGLAEQREAQQSPIEFQASRSAQPLTPVPSASSTSAFSNTASDSSFVMSPTSTTSSASSQHSNDGSVLMRVEKESSSSRPTSPAQGGRRYTALIETLMQQNNAQAEQLRMANEKIKQQEEKHNALHEKSQQEAAERQQEAAARKQLEEKVAATQKQVNDVLSPNDSPVDAGDGAVQIRRAAATNTAQGNNNRQINNFISEINERLGRVEQTVAVVVESSDIPMAQRLIKPKQETGARDALLDDSPTHKR